ncbi:MAG: ethylammeline chlorohydrolase [Acidobacteriota bacterium]
MSQKTPDRPTRPPGPETLLRGGIVLTMDAEFRVFEGGDIRIVGDRIAEVGSALAPAPGARVVDVSGCAVLPGLVQGHLHLGQTLFQGLAEERRLLAWLRERIWPLEAAHDADSVRASVRLGAAQLLLGGTTTIQEIGLGPEAEALVDAVLESGLRGYAGKCLMDEGDGLPARLAEPTTAALDEAVRLGERIEREGMGRLRPVLNPRFVLSCSDPMLRAITEISAERGWPVHTHAFEQREEGAAVRAARGGRDELAVFAELGLLERDLRIAHGVWLPRRSWAELARRRFSVVHCPGSNLKLGSGIARVAAMLRAGLRVGIGADGAACNNRLDAWEEMRLASRLQTVREGPGALGGRQALSLATRDGARALGLEREIGSLEPGKAADVVVLDLARPELVAAPGVDPHDRLVFGASPAAVRDVWIGGVPRVEGGELVGAEVGRILEEAAVAAARVGRRAGVGL